MGRGRPNRGMFSKRAEAKTGNPTLIFLAKKVNVHRKVALGARIRAAYAGPSRPPVPKNDHLFRSHAADVENGLQPLRLRPQLYYTPPMVLLQGRCPAPEFRCAPP